MKSYIQLTFVAVMITSIAAIPLHNQAFGQAVPSDVFIAGFCDASFSPPSISYGTVAPGVPSSEVALTVTNAGSATAASYTVEGTTWLAGADYTAGSVPVFTNDPLMDVGQTHYATAAGVPYASKTVLTGSPTSFAGPIPPGGSVTMFWQLDIAFLFPIVEYVGPSTQTVTVTGAC